MSEPASGSGTPHHPNPVIDQKPGTEAPQWAAQLALAAMMRFPEKSLIALLQERFPARDNSFYGVAIRHAREAISRLLDGPLRAAAGSDSTPILLDRVSFTWKLLRQADVLVRKLKKAELPECTDMSHVSRAFINLLPQPLQPLEPPLVNAVAEWLRLGPDGRFLYHYWCFRRGTPMRLPAPFNDVAKRKDVHLLRTVIWWCLRNRKEEFIEAPPNETPRVEYDFVVRQISGELKRCCGNEIEQFPGVDGHIEYELDEWLKYSRLDPSSGDLDPEFAKAFIKHNGLDRKLVRMHQPAPAGAAGNSEQVRQLEATVQQYADEIRDLEERLRGLQSALDASKFAQNQAPPSPQPGQPEPEIATFLELREVLKTVDSKYAFDTLHAVQLGEETHLTFRSFAAHLFYALRKRGFSEYPKDESFDLTYESSGLYECEGFEVQPGSSIPVRVTRRGWALKARGHWLPVRRARVCRRPAE